jgi:hypothetical protein
MSITFYTFGPHSLVISGISSLTSLGYSIDCQSCTSMPAQGVAIYNIIELIRLIKGQYRANGNEKITLLVIE